MVVSNRFQDKTSLSSPREFFLISCYDNVTVNVCHIFFIYLCWQKENKKKLKSSWNGNEINKKENETNLTWRLFPSIVIISKFSRDIATKSYLKAGNIELQTVWIHFTIINLGKLRKSWKTIYYFPWL